jgi:hypothetical protein
MVTLEECQHGVLGTTRRPVGHPFGQRGGGMVGFDPSPLKMTVGVC